MIVEYLGISGSGKTFMLTRYKQQLIDKGIPFLDISRYAGMPLWMKLLYKVSDYLITVLPKYRRSIRLYKEACFDCYSGDHQEATFLNTSFDYCIKDIVLATFIHDVLKGSSRIILNDEGLLHRIAMLIMLYGADVNKIMAVYHKEEHYMRTIFVDTQVEKAFANIRSRNRHICGFDEMGDEMLYGFLSRFDAVCRKVLSLSESRNIEIGNKE